MLLILMMKWQKRQKLKGEKRRNMLKKYKRLKEIIKFWLRKIAKLNKKQKQKRKNW